MTQLTTSLIGAKIIGVKLTDHIMMLKLRIYWIRLTPNHSVPQVAMTVVEVQLMAVAIVITVATPTNEYFRWSGQLKGFYTRLRGISKALATGVPV